MENFTHDTAITSLAQSLDQPAIRFWFLLALGAGALIAIFVGLLWAMTRPRRAYRMLVRRVRASRGLA